MSATPRVSIIIPTYNRPERLKRSVASALRQTAADVEVIVVDDGSTPAAVVDDGVTLLRTPNRGASAARNAGLDRATGDYLMFLDSDDWLEPDAVARLLATMRAGAARVAFGRWRNVDEAAGKTDVVIPHAPYADGLANAVAGGWMPGSFMMDRALAARFDPSMILWEVVAFECESMTSGDVAARCDAVVVNVAQHSEMSRISNRLDHFEPLMTARTFIAMRSNLAARRLLNRERVAAFEGRLLPCLHALMRARRREAREIYEAIRGIDGAFHRTVRVGSFPWCVRHGGFAGARGFVFLNRMLGR